MSNPQEIPGEKCMSRFLSIFRNFAHVYAFLLSAMVLLAQNAPEPTPQNGAGEAATTPSILCSRPHKTVSRVEAESLSDAAGVNLQPYLESSVLPLIRANWFRQLSKSGENIGGQATIQFTVLKDGAVAGVKLTDGAGHAALGELAMSAVAKSGPF
jgi:TonB family protein